MHIVSFIDSRKIKPNWKYRYGTRVNAYFLPGLIYHRDKKKLKIAHYTSKLINKYADFSERTGVICYSRYVLATKT